MKIGIIGGAGFVGTRLARRLEMAGTPYVIGDIAPLEQRNMLTADVRSIESLQSLPDIDVVVNLAAVHRDDVRPVTLYDETNVNGAVQVCNFCRTRGIDKIIFTSSVAIYGFAPPDTGENGSPNYFNDYGRTKYEAELVYQEWLQEAPDVRSLVIVRPTVIFGEGNRGNVFNLLRQIASKRFAMIGPGDNYKSVAYVENVAAFLEHSIDFGPGLHVYNYVDKPDMNMNSLVIFVRKYLLGKEDVGIRIPAFAGLVIGAIADAVARVLNRNLPISAIRVKKFLATSKYSTAISETDFSRPVDLYDGLKNTLQYEFVDDNVGQRTFETE